MLYRDQNIILGCMRIADKPIEEVKDLIQTALDLGIISSTMPIFTGKGNRRKFLRKRLTN